MNLNLNGHHVDITPALRDYVTSKLDRILRHSDHIIDATVILSVDKLQQRAEAHLSMRGSDIFVEAVQADMYAAIDMLVDKLDRQVVKHKEKNFDPRHNGAMKRLSET